VGSTFDDAQIRRKNLRTALVLASIAAVFFVGVVIKYLFFA
jgi:hypothetical protein